MAELCKQHDDYDKWLLVRPQRALHSYINAEHQIIVSNLHSLNRRLVIKIFRNKC
jgi:hypothetical protein